MSREKRNFKKKSKDSKHRRKNLQIPLAFFYNVYYNDFVLHKSVRWIGRKGFPMNDISTPNKPRTADVIKSLVVRACCIFTGVTSFLLVFQWIMEKALQKSLAAEVFLMLIPLSLCLSGAGMIRKAATVSPITKIILHPLLSLGGLLIVYLPYMISNHFPPATALVHILVFTICYGMVTAIICLISGIAHKKSSRASSAPYVSQFKK